MLSLVRSSFRLPLVGLAGLLIWAGSAGQAAAQSGPVLPTTYANGGPAGVDVRTAITDLGGLGLAIGYAGGPAEQLLVSDGTTNGLTALPDVQPFAPAGTPALDEPNNPLFGVLGTQAVFAATDPNNGTELWITDGTAAHTHLLRDIWPGPESSTPRWFFRLGDQVLFAAVDADHGMELWRTDGTSAGTTLVSDIVPGPASSYPNLLGVSAGQVFFVAQSGAIGSELWRTDGTASGTRMVTDLPPGPDAMGIWRMTTGPDLAYFQGEDAWWRTDGTAAGTWKVLPDINLNSRVGMIGDALYDLQFLDGVASLSRADGSHSDPTAIPLADPHTTSDMFVSGNALLVSTRDSLYCSDGTTSDPVKLIDLTPFGGWTGGFSYLDGAVYLRAGRSDSNARLVMTDGTAQGTHVVGTAVPPIENTGASWPIYPVGHRLMFPEVQGFGSLISVGPTTPIAGTFQCGGHPAPTSPGGGSSGTGGRPSGSSGGQGQSSGSGSGKGASTDPRALLRSVSAPRLAGARFSFVQHVLAGVMTWRLILSVTTAHGTHRYVLAHTKLAIRISARRRLTMRLSSASRTLLRHHKNARLVLVTSLTSTTSPTLTVRVPIQT